MDRRQVERDADRAADAYLAARVAGLSQQDAVRHAVRTVICPNARDAARVVALMDRMGR